MKSVCGIDIPCLDCLRKGGCRHEWAIYHRAAILFTTPNSEPLTCEGYKEPNWHGIDGVTA